MDTKITRRDIGKLAFAFAASSLSFSAKSNQPNWPAKPVRLLVGFPAGSPPDLVARALAEPLAERLGQAVLVENRVGSGGNIAATAIANSNDGHTIGLVINGALTTAQFLSERLPYDPDNDFKPISLIATTPLVLVARKDLPTGAAFFDAARSSGDSWNYGSIGPGTGSHLWVELLKQRFPGMAAQHVPFGSSPQLIASVLQGTVHMAALPPLVVLPHVRTGALHAICLTGPRHPLAPGVPSASEVGATDLFPLEGWAGLVGPASLPSSVITKLSELSIEIMRNAETRQRLFNQGWRALGTAPEALQAQIRQESEALGPVIRRLGLRHE